MRAELFEDVLNMVSHGHRADVQRVGDLFAVLAGRELSQHVSFSRAQRKGGRNLRHRACWTHGTPVPHGVREGVPTRSSEQGMQFFS